MNADLLQEVQQGKGFVPCKVAGNRRLGANFIIQSHPRFGITQGTLEEGLYA